MVNVHSAQSAMLHIGIELNASKFQTFSPVCLKLVTGTIKLSTEVDIARTVQSAQSQTF